MTSFLLALQFLTVFPWPRRPQRAAPDLGRAASFFPLVGFVLGAVLAAVDFLISPLASPALTSAILVALLALLTRGLHLDALADAVDGLGAGGSRERMLQVMDDSRTGAFGAAAIALTLLLKTCALEGMDGERWRALMAAPVLGRWSMVALGYRSKAAKPGLGSELIDALSTEHLVVATLIASLLLTAILQAAGFAMVLCLAVLTLACKTYFHRRLGGVTGDLFGAVGELSETLAIIWLALGVR